MSLAVIVAALGYFVDIYDLILFGMVRTPSLKALGITGDALTTEGLYLLNMQMGGMLLGGILWGVIGDKRGRLSVLFGSIAMYSVANIANGTVDTLQGYAICRLIAGIGLAGELGAGITLVSELMGKHNRGVGTTLVAALGVSGGVVAGLIGGAFPGVGVDWRTAYYIGGGMGLALLALRIGVVESGMFRETVKRTNVSRGNFFKLFTDRARLVRYVAIICVGVPVWYVIGILFLFSRELGGALGDVAVLLLRGLRGRWARLRPAQPVSEVPQEGARDLPRGDGAVDAGVLHDRWDLAHRVLRDLLRRWRRLWLLGGVRRDGGRAVRHQPPCDGDHHGAELRPRLRGPRHHRVQGPDPEPGPGRRGDRRWDRDARDRGRRPRLPARDVRRRPRLPRGRSGPRGVAARYGGRVMFGIRPFDFTPSPFGMNASVPVVLEPL